ncbi:MAG TPA: hypothetical protein ENH82_02575 [bacterium]|nr:hypothetical protein [bacterium]
MKKTIWKYAVLIQDTQKIEMPKGAKLLTVQVQRGIAFIWAMVNPMNTEVERIIKMVGTGHDLSEQIMGDYIGTFQINNEWGGLVFHVFDGGEK